MRRFIYNTQGTGISHEQIFRLENTQPGPGTYLEGDMRVLGDEIMLLDGLDDAEALDALGYVGAGNYRSRAADMDGFSLSAAEALSVNRRAGRSFAPYGLGSPTSPAGRRAGRAFAPYGLGEEPEVSPEREYMMKHPDQFISPSFYPLEDAEHYASPLPKPGTWLDGFALSGSRMIDLSASEGDDWSYEGWQSTPAPGTWLNGFGDAASDQRAALATARSIGAACASACGLIQEANPAATTAAQARCRAGCGAALHAAEAAINSAIRPGTTGPASPEQQAVINAKLDQLRLANEQAAAGMTPTPPSTELTTNQKLMIGGGVVLLAGLAFVALRK